MKYINKLFIPFRIIQYGIKVYPYLYFLFALSVVSIVTEVTAMALVASISSGKYYFLESLLSLLDKNLLFLMVLILFLIRFISMFVVEKYQNYITRSFQALLSEQSLHKILRMPLAQVENKELGYFVSMAGDEASRAAEMLNASFKVFNASILFILYACMIGYIDLKILFILFVLMSLSTFAVLLIARKVTFYGRNSVVESRKTSSIYFDILNGLKMVKSFAIEDFSYQKYKSEMQKYQITNYKIFLLSLVTTYFPVIILISILIIYTWFDYITSKSLSAVYLISIFFILMRFLLNLGELLHTANKIIGNIDATKNIIEFIQSPLKEKQVYSNTIGTIKSIVFHHVDFYYEKKNFIFKNWNLEFYNAKSYAIVGQTGGGKSTLIDLMMDFLKPSSGEIKINNISTAKISSNALKEKIIYISQEAIIFNDTIRNNLCLDKNYTDKEIFYALSVVQLDDFVKSMPNELNYVLQYKGTNLSGGQRQRLNIARGILRNSDVLILDETINALDKNTRQIIVKNLLELYKEKLIIFITHDLEVLDLIDEVVDLDQIKALK